LRHAETSAPDRFHGAESDIGLSAWGTRQAEMLGESFKEMGAAALYCSAMRRAVATAEPIGIACNLVPIVTPALHERRLGPLSGISREEGWSIYAQSKSHWIAGDIEYSHPGGESYADIRRRVIPIVQEIVASHGGQTVIIVAHGVVIRVILTSLLAGYQPGDFDRVAIDFASVNDLWFDGENWTVQELNRVVASSTARPVA
jgi:2,3-bisphosphoglycerate-dependent phosphoglycerate mutase